MTSPHPAQGSPSDSYIDPEADGDVGITELFGPPPRADEVFPAAMFAAPYLAPELIPDTAAEAETAVSEVMDQLPPGHPSGPLPVVAPGDEPADGFGYVAEPPPPPPPPPEAAPRRHRTAAFVTVAAVALAGAGAAATYAAAHKTVTVDVDGETTTVETFEGDVADLLAGEGVEVGVHDEVTPGLDATLREGDTVVVRSGHRLTLRADGERRTAWVAALDADQALATLSAQGDDVVLLPTRAGGTATLPLPLDTDGPVTLVAGGETREVAEGAVTLDRLLAAHDVRVDGDDRISVGHRQPEGATEPVLTVVVRTVQASIEETVSEIPFETVTASDPDHYVDLAPYLARSGAPGERVTSWDVTRIDGEVVAKEKLNSWVSKQPVDKLIMYGSKPRPKPKPEPKDKATEKSTEKSTQKDTEKSTQKDTEKGAEKDAGKGDGKGDDKGGDEGDDADPDGETQAQSLSAPAGGVWSSLAECESGGNPATNTGNGYYGLYQFSQETWEAMGGSGLPSEASAAEQTMRAQALQERSGWGQWPACSSALGLS
ncbi:transglycosylase family protein [Promicromonospora thailandica]|uniref:Uncharacterized conserved protein YabE, contains G5 and tandem DUF348 domains n=1 Tax=Promicromonospora thailandica TaxID=765201 RepID=A0A9X2G7A2_9MICO|nr:resuscitation-promoting factor [Promicromonospora thailandica]MCP2264549.1 Uncharacterized conserved protein YabE, contains G5 and tandem DUF348 domains [Promicromonospora thailandica]